jgi:pimeloyl-ACP methyl ester carboxylesterase
MSPPAPSLAELHDEQIVALLRSGAHAALLTAYFGDLAYRELSHLARLAAIRRDERGPTVLILPGMMGSRLGDPQRHAAGLIWLHPAAIGEGLLSALTWTEARRLSAVGIMLPGYLKLKLSLEVAGFRPLFHPFDWRDDVTHLGRQLLHRIEQHSQPVMLVAHSMGGLVARAALAQDRSRRIARLIQLGSPNHGSFAPVQALRAVYPTVRKIAALDFRHSAEELARDVFRTLPGLYQLLPTQPRDLFDADAWPDDDLRPDPTLLAQARKARQRLAAADERCVVIAGTNQDTVVAATVSGSQFAYSIRRDGDGTVPLASAHWPGARTWFVEETHGGLTLNTTVLAAVDDLLRSGQTDRLSQQAPGATPAGERVVTDEELRSQAIAKVRWESLSLESRRRILEPVLTAEFLAPSSI